MDKHLQTMWEEINRDHFGEELKPLADIEWDELSGENGIGAHGRFFPKGNCIAIDEKFRFDEKAMKAGDQQELKKIKVAYCLVMHEMVHQLLHQRNDPKSGGHGESFLAEATRISKQMGVEPPTTENVHHWPLQSVGG
jgi:SprT-like family protein